MPFKSQAQNRFFHAAANKPGGLGSLSQPAAQKFINDTSGQKVSKLPQFASLKAKLSKTPLPTLPKLPKVK